MFCPILRKWSFPTELSKTALHENIIRDYHAKKVVVVAEDEDTEESAPQTLAENEKENTTLILQQLEPVPAVEPKRMTLRKPSSRIPRPKSSVK